MTPQALTLNEVDALVVQVYRDSLDDNKAGGADRQIEDYRTAYLNMTKQSPSEALKSAHARQARNAQIHRVAVIRTLELVGLYTRPVRIAPVKKAEPV